jgi:hypothetical protein
MKLIFFFQILSSLGFVLSNFILICYVVFFFFFALELDQSFNEIKQVYMQIFCRNQAELANQRPVLQRILVLVFRDTESESVLNGLDIKPCSDKTLIIECSLTYTK